MKSRTLKVANYLNRERMAGYKEIANATGESERAVRYDVESINRELSFRRYPCIEKLSKGMLLVPDQLDLSVLNSDQEYIYSNEDRIALLKMQVLFDVEHLNLTKSCEKMQISRRSIQNDIEEVQKELSQKKVALVYEKKYHIEADAMHLFVIRGRELKKYIEILRSDKLGNTFEKEMCEFVENQMQPISSTQIFKWIDETMEEMGWVLTDDSYQWYAARVLVFCWYLKNQKDLPSDMKEDECIIGNKVRELEQILNITLTEQEKRILGCFSRFTSKYVDFDIRQDLVSVEDIAMYLVREMKKALQIDFVSDGILLKGLLNHLGPMLLRMKEDVQLHEDAQDFIPEQYAYVYESLKEITGRHPVLKNLTENEAIYIAVFFLGSIRRLQQNQYMTVLLICGFGYGTTAVVKDALLNTYQVFVKNSIPVHKVAHYENWDEIDLVISTVKVELPVKKKLVNVNVIFTNEDYIKLDLAGLRKKNTLTNLFSIEKKLDFLGQQEKDRVMDVIKEELGYKEVRIPKKYYALSDLLMAEDVVCVRTIDDWRDAVKCSTEILQEHGKITEDYHESIIKSMEVQGFYSVTDGRFALLHGSETAGVRQSCMSLIISEKPICFGEKKVQLVFCLASRDKKEHIPAITRMMRMIQMTAFIERLSKCRSAEEAFETIRACEKEVESCYPS